MPAPKLNRTPGDLTAVVDQAARRRHEAALERPTDGHPPPTVQCRPATSEDPIPSAARTLHNQAVGAGWTSWMTYAQGWITHSTTNKPLRVVDSIAVRIRNEAGNRRAVACYLAGKMDCCLTLVDGILTVVDKKTLVTMIKGGPDEAQN